MRRDDGLDHRTRFVATGVRPQVDPPHHLVDRSVRERLAVGQQHDRVGQPRDLGDRVAHVDDRNMQIVAQPLDVAQHLALARHVERGERLVHQQDPRLREQRAADRHALLFAAGELVRQSLQQRLEPEQFDDVRRIDDTRGSRRATQSVEQVGLDVEVREKQCVLEYVAEPSLVRRQVDAASAVEQRLAVDDDASALRAADAGDRVDDAGLARARAAEQTDDRRLGAKRDLELEHAEPLLDVNVDHRRLPSCAIVASAIPKRSAPRSTGRRRTATAAAPAHRRRASA